MTSLKVVRYAVWGTVALIVIAVGLTVYWRQTDSLPGVITASIGGPFTLTDETGASVTEASLKGHPSAMFFGYTLCPDVCPTTLFEVTSWLEALGPDADKLKVYFVTVDPERDTREVLAEYLGAFDPRIVGLTGTRPEIDQMLKVYRVYSRKATRDTGPYLMDHTASMYLLDKDGAFTGIIYYQDEKGLEKLKKLIAGA